MVHKNAPTCHSSILIYLGVLQDIEGIQNKINEFKNKKHSLYLIKLMCGARRWGRQNKNSNGLLRPQRIPISICRFEYVCIMNIYIFTKPYMYHVYIGV